MAFRIRVTATTREVMEKKVEEKIQAGFKLISEHADTQYNGTKYIATLELEKPSN